VQRAQVSAALGLFNLKMGTYNSAAERFLEVTMDLDGKYREIIGARDCAIYGALCALACYQRGELKGKVQSNSQFKSLMELAPGWRSIVNNFQQSNYAAVFAALEGMKNDLYLDMWLAPHVDRLISRVRDRALIQYFRPFVSVKIPAMATAFKMDVPSLEKNLVLLIGGNQISARIDSANKILYARHADQRNVTFQQSMSIGTKYVRDLKSTILRMSLVQHNFIIKASQKKRGGDEDEDDRVPMSLDPRDREMHVRDRDRKG